MLDLPGLTFDAERHAYAYQGARLTGVTSLVREFAPPFHANQIAGRIAARRGDGSTADDVLAEWAHKRDAGSAAHRYAATVAELGVPDPPLDPGDVLTYGEAFLEFTAGISAFWRELEPEPVAWERPIAWAAAGVAGTLDLLARIGGHVYLVDYKTDSELHMGTKERMKPPLDHLPSRSWTQHSLQLSMYRLMLAEQYSVTVDRIALVHLTDGSYSLEHVVYLRGECEDMLRVFIAKDAS